MPKTPLTVSDLWALPRVGVPAPAPDGAFAVVPVTTYDLDENRGTTRLWRVDLGTASTEPRAVTSATTSSTAPAVSPDGARLAFVRKVDGVGQLHVMDLDGGEPTCLTEVPYDVIDPMWFPDGRAVAFLSFVHGETGTLEATAERKAELADAPTPPIVTEDRWYRHWDQWLTDGRRLHLFRVDLDSGTVRDLTPKLTGIMPPMDPTGHYDIAPDGREIAIVATRRKRDGPPARYGLHLAALRADGTASALRDVTPKGGVEALHPRYAPDGSTILYGVVPDPTRWSERPRIALYRRGAKAHETIGESWTLTPSAWAWRRDGKAILVHAGAGGTTGLFSMSPKTGAVREIARGGTFAGLGVTKRSVVTAQSSLRAPAEVVEIALTGGAIEARSAFTAPIMAQRSVGRVEDLMIPGANGDDIQMYLVHPPRTGTGRTKGKAPSKPSLVHLIHGGPHANFGDTWHHRWNAQAFAAQGHLVALVNYHGSDGWGHVYRESILGAWGDLPYRDIEHATDWLIDERNVDPKRMAATGGSYGGYMASWIAAQSDRYACIVNHAGVCDLQTQFGCDEPEGWPKSAGGALWQDQDGLDRFNPLRHADGFATPMLILHGELDYRVPYYQALQIYNIYKARGLDARLVFYRDENHWILKPRNSVHWYGEVFDWLKRWL